jgi:hypothetical protein
LIGFPNGSGSGFEKDSCGRKVVFLKVVLGGKGVVGVGKDKGPTNIWKIILQLTKRWTVKLSHGTLFKQVNVHLGLGLGEENKKR